MDVIQVACDDDDDVVKIFSPHVKMNGHAMGSYTSMCPMCRLCKDFLFVYVLFSIHVKKRCKSTMWNVKLHNTTEKIIVLYTNSL